MVLFAHWTALSSFSAPVVDVLLQSFRVVGAVTGVQLTPALTDRQMWPLPVTAYPTLPPGWKARSTKFSPGVMPVPAVNALPFQNAIVPPLVAYQKRVGDW